MRILTWHVHGSYLYYLVQARDHEFYLPVKPGKPEGYGGRAGDFPWPDNVFDIPAEEVRNERFDVIVFQSRKNYLEDQHETLSAEQREVLEQFAALTSDANYEPDQSFMDKVRAVFRQ